MTESHASTLFERHRARLFGMAYRMLGSVHDAEDLVQDAYLRWHQTDVPAVTVPEAWLMTLTTRLCIDKLRRATRERALYSGTWLPEPLVGELGPAPDRGVEIGSDLSLAFLVLLQRLAPEERAALLLREVFDCEYCDIASTLQKTEAACRQLVHRAQVRVRAGAPRFAVSPEAHIRLLEGFVTALRSCDREGLLELLSDDVTLASDGGGKVPAARHELSGRSRVGHLLLTVQRKRLGACVHRMVLSNREPALLSLSAAGEPLSVTCVRTDGHRIVSLYRLLNPDKLRNVPAYPSIEGDKTPAGAVMALRPLRVM